MKSAELTGHAHHILPIKVYVSVTAALLVLTGITVLVSQFDFGPWNLLAAMVIAALKASLVALFFMHLKYDNKFFAIVFLIAVATLAMFIILTMFDTLKRGDIDLLEASTINRYASIYDAGGVPIPMKDRIFAISQEQRQSMRYLLRSNMAMAPLRRR